MKVLEHISQHAKRVAKRVTLAITVAPILIGSVNAQEKNTDAEAKELIRQWVTTERLLGEELNSWKQQKAEISELLGLYKKELKLLNEELAKTGKSVAQVDQKKADLEAKVSQSIQTRKKLRAFLIKLSPRVLAVEKRFPVSLQAQVADSIAVLESANDETSVRDLLQAVINVIEQANTFNAGIYQSSESITIGSDTWNAEVIYLGLGRAYFYVGTKAGIGTPSVDGWQWQRKDEILDEVKKAVKVFKKQIQPQLVELPVKVQP